MRTAKSLIRLGGCPGWSESSLGAQPHCWFCHEAAQIYSNWSLYALYISFTEHINSIYLHYALICNISADIWAATWQNQQNCPAKTQICLGIRPVWSEPSLSAWRKLGSLASHWAFSEDSDQTGRMPRLIWVFAGRTFILLVLWCRSSYVVWSSSVIRYSHLPITRMQNRDQYRKSITEVCGLALEGSQNAHLL